MAPQNLRFSAPDLTVGKKGKDGPVVYRLTRLTLVCEVIRYCWFKSDKISKKGKRTTSVATATAT